MLVILAYFILHDSPDDDSIAALYKAWYMTAKPIKTVELPNYPMIQFLMTTYHSQCKKINHSNNYNNDNNNHANYNYDRSNNNDSDTNVPLDNFSINQICLLPW